jgi:L,D-peptidoglycan transpeptidase YkuD (ErfK/YbiS/YcfS/YnhG family)
MKRLISLMATAAVLLLVPVAAQASALPDGLQKITVTASSYSTSWAKLSAWKSSGGHWVRVYGPWTARAGYNGIAPVGTETENSGKTPAGTYGFGFMFGVQPRPSGITWTSWWHRARWYDKWDDDPASARYNLWTNILVNDAGRNPEPMHVSPAYDYGIVIAYNTARVPGAGSAIFLHVRQDGATAGCVSVWKWQLLKLLRWLRPDASPVIVISG